MPLRSRCGATDRILLKEAALILRRDGPDDRLEGHGPPVAIPPLSLAQVTGGECELTAPDGHGDGDQVALLTYRTGALRLVAHDRMVCECSPFDHSLLTPFHAPQTGPVTRRPATRWWPRRRMERPPSGEAGRRHRGRSGGLRDAA